MKQLLAFLFVILISLCPALAGDIRFYGSDKLSCSLFTDMLQDSRGYLWIATGYGLNRYDGVTFEGYYNDASDPSSLMDDNVLSLCEDRQHRLWVGTNVGLQRYDPVYNCFESIPFHDVVYPSIQDVLSLRSGELLVATSGYGIGVLDEDTRELSRYEALNQAAGSPAGINRMFEDAEGRLWLATSKNGLIALKKDTDGQWKRLPEGLFIHNNASAVTEATDGTILVAAGGWVYLLAPGGKEFVPLGGRQSDGYQIHAIGRLSDGEVYVATYGRGFYRVNREEGRLASVEVDNPWLYLPEANAVCFCEDRDKNVWIGCFQSGLLQISHKSDHFVSWAVPEGKSLSGLYVDRDGTVWGGVSPAGFGSFDEQGRFTLRCPMKETVISACRKDDHTFWVGTYGHGLLEVDLRRGTATPVFKESFRRIKSLVTDESGHYLYVADFGYGVNCFAIGDRSLTPADGQQADIDPALKNRWVNVMMRGRGNKLWIGHYQGIDCYDMGSRSYVTLPGDSVLGGCICYSLLEDRQGNIWIGTNKGLWMYDPVHAAFTAHTAKEGLVGGVVCGLAEDKAGNIWCSTFKGISRIHREKGREASIINYFSTSELGNSEYMRGLYGYDAVHDRVYFGQSVGVTSFQPVSMAVEAYRHPVVLTHVFIGNLPVDKQMTTPERKYKVDRRIEDVEHIELAHEDNIFSLVFSTMDFVNAGNIYYEYRFANRTPVWSRTLAGENRIAFMHLPAGTYQLEVRACLNGSYSPVKTLWLEVRPVWYLSGWAYLVYALLLLAILYLVYYFIRRKQQEKLSEEKLRFFINVAHELRSPMTLIISPLESLLGKPHDAATTKALRAMYRNSNRILSLLNQLLDIRRIDKGQMKMALSRTDLVVFIDDLYQLFAFQAEKKHITFSFEHEADELYAWIDRNNFDKVLVNILSNALKYTPDGGDIRIVLREGHDSKRSGALKDYVEIAVSDTGSGIDENKLERIFERFYQASSSLHTNSLGFGIGLNLARLLVELHHGTIVAMNRKDTHGSIFVIHIPLGNAHLRADELCTEEPDFHSLELPQPAGLSAIGTGQEEENRKSVRAKTSYKVLVVDDDEEVCSFVRTELEPIYKVVTAGNGKEAMQLVLSEQPDLVVSDVVMPEMDGYALVKMLKTNDATSHIPIILLSSKSELSDRLQGLESGVDAYLAKPFVMQELESLIYTTLTNRMKLRGKLLGLTESDEVKLPEIKSNDSALMERVMRSIQENIANPDFSVESLAEAVGLSRVQLHRKLKELTGLPASDLIRNVRMKHAATLLKENKVNIAQVAYAVGYTNQTYFSTCFRKYWGVSPTDYIEKVSQ